MLPAAVLEIFESLVSFKDKAYGKTHEESDSYLNFSNGVVINGVALPDRVVAELKRLGITLSWYSAGELENAVQACAFDAQLIDDPNGDDFLDKLVLTQDEQQDAPPKPNFQERLLAQRAKKLIIGDEQDEPEERSRGSPLSL